MSILTVIKQDQDCAIHILDNCGGNWQSVSKEIAKYRTEREAQAVQREREAAKGLGKQLEDVRARLKRTQAKLDFYRSKLSAEKCIEYNTQFSATYNDNRKG
jgi:molecular chaperone GrpE (heat shock protein)